MNEIHIVGYILTYIALFITLNNEIKVSLDTTMIHDNILYVLQLLPAIAALYYDNNHLFKILAYCYGFISLLHIVKGANSHIKDYMHVTLLASILVNIYNIDIVKNYMILAYFYYFSSVVLSLSKKQNAVSTVLTEFLISHLVFFFTKT